MGVLHRDGAEFTFEYEASWRDLPAAVPLSVSMPLARRAHPHASVAPFLWGLLPDSIPVLDAWARRFHVSAGNPFSLLRHVGEDCAGAVQFVTEERLDHAVQAQHRFEVQWVTPKQVGQRLAGLVEDASAGRLATDSGQFSLGGAQAKTALHKRGRRWGVPFGATPTTHILKPPVAGLDAHCENEHLMLNLAQQVGLAAAHSTVQTFGDQTAIVVERYDRVPAGDGRIQRVHQEDLCQALSVVPSRKYQNEGGPTPAQVIQLLRRASTRPEQDVGAFVDALLFNWIIGGTDAHAKNYSLLLARGQVRLAPLYDLASALPYDHLDQRRLKLAMKLGGTYKLQHIGVRELRAFAAEHGLDGDRLVDRATTLASKVAEVLDDVFGPVGSLPPSLATLYARLARRAVTLRAA